ncbi:SDR family NAD(P)-dependent oxidoreductase [Planctomyces sp. SH-PL14]|uniref:SDR family NAD(P)-dependent oxidoreductase n=1 Tax=Planctomyces sp. SH-PL14 TaxID=1632864 RepID=UPI00078ED792|nr:SDR family oxidoreductase [Planctomyces sp. SH-PL14]AMV17722.1 3-oxoacyl-[acyl-carrier-protein] reductase FabG [Planctomyces sp. SH-PL14]
MDLGLKDTVAVITGGASGIGLATARLFLQEGARAILLDRSEQVSAVAAGLQEETGRAAAGVACDVADEESVLHAAERAQDRFGQLDHVVHCAAVGSGKFGFPFTNLKPRDWRSSLEINILGMVHVAHAFAPRLTERKEGTMTFLASVAGQIGSQTDPPYSASKAANINFAQCLAKDLAPHGIRINTVCPGMVRTPLNESVWRAWNDQQPPEGRKSYEEWAGAKVRSVVPLGRWQTPEDIAAMIVFLASRRADNVTGQTINVDGGFVMHW